MSLNKGKAKVKSKSKSVAKSAGKSKAAVMNSRNPKKPMAISGDTMSNYAMYKKGGKVKYAAGGSKFPDLTGDGKVTKADILKGRGVIKKKGGLVKAQAGIWKKEKTINEDGSSMTRRTSNNPITGNTRQVTKVKSADGDKSRSVKISSRKKGGSIKKKYQKGGSTVKQLGTGSKVDILKNTYKKYIKK